MAITNLETAVSIHQETAITIERKKQNLIGQTIEKVFYVVADYKDRPFQYEGFHLNDEAICIQLSNQQWISWVWLEDDPTVAYCYHLYYENARSAIEKREQEGIAFLKRSGLYTPDSHSKWLEVTETDAWKKFIGQPIEDVQFRTTKIDEISFVSDLIIHVKNAKVRIIAFEEPEPDVLPEIENLNFDPVWTMVVFDDTILKQHNRL
ncbi:MAG: hypothetical protein AAF617_10240 [Bacteroidota bacterium]